MDCVRKIVVHGEDLLSELGQPVRSVARRVTAAAVIANPWLHRGVVEDLNSEVVQIAPGLARELTARLVAAVDGVDRVEAFGKAAIVGLDGEVEHGAALMHTPYFGNVFRELVEGSSIICFSEERATAGASLSVPMWHKTAASTRSHYQSVPVRIPDAPRPDEIVLVAAVSSGPRPNARIGDRRTDPRVRLNDLELSR
jgi:Amino acid synthesis